MLNINNEKDKKESQSMSMRNNHPKKYNYSKRKGQVETKRIKKKKSGEGKIRRLPKGQKGNKKTRRESEGSRGRGVGTLTRNNLWRMQEEGGNPAGTRLWW